MLIRCLPRVFIRQIYGLSPTTSSTSRFRHRLHAILFARVPRRRHTNRGAFSTLLARGAQASRSSLAELQTRLQATMHNCIKVTTFQTDGRTSRIRDHLSLGRTSVSTTGGSLRATGTTLTRVSATDGSSKRLTKLVRHSRRVRTSQSRLTAHQDAGRRRRTGSHRQLDKVRTVTRQTRTVQTSITSLGDRTRTLLNNKDTRDPCLRLAIGAKECRA